MKQQLNKTLVAIVVLVFSTLTLVSCVSSEESIKGMVEEENTWDSIKALPEGVQPTVLTRAQNLNAYTSLRDFTSIRDNLYPEAPFPETPGITHSPAYCHSISDYILYDSNSQNSDSPFSASLGGGWVNNLLDSKKGRTVSFSIFADLGKSDYPLIQLLSEEIEKCPIVIQEIKDVRWNYEFELREDSENTITVFVSVSNENGFSGKGQKSINQVGRNLIASYLVKFSWNGIKQPSVTEQEEQDLISSWVSMAAKIIARQS